MVATDAKAQYKVIGGSPLRPDGTDKVTGRAEYGADVQLKGMLHGRVLRSPHAHAVIKRIDTSRALALDGVHAVITAADFPDPGDRVVATIRGPVPLRWNTDQIMASQKVRFKGQAVAAVCAADPHVAEDALELIDVQYEVLPPVLSGRAAMDPSSPVLFDGVDTAAIDGLFEPVDGRPTNVARRVEFQQGDIEEGFREADLIIEREFETGTAHQGYIEGHIATAFWSLDGELTVWTTTQGAFGVRQILVDLLQLPLTSIRVIPTEIGGGFGGKNSVYVDPIAAMLSKHSGRAVQVTMTRSEVLEATGPTSATTSRVRVGVKQDGTIVAAEAHLYYEAGGYPGSPVPAGARCLFSPYHIPHQYVEGLDIVVNKPKAAAYRAPGAPQAAFAIESVLDEIALQLDIDPLELRLKNAAREDSLRVDGLPQGVVGHSEVIRTAIESPHYRSELQGKDRGRGVAVGWWFNAGGESSAFANLNADGTVSLIVGSVDIGGQRAALAMQFAETMSMPYEEVKPTVTDTDSIGFTGNTGGSRTTFATGWAVYDAALDLRRQLEQRTALIWEVDAKDVSYDDGVLRGPDGKTFTLKEIARKLPQTGGGLQGRADVTPKTVGSALAAHIVDVEVDRETGKVEILRYTAVQDVGTAIHPAYVEGQIQGGAVQGIGMALSEEYVFDDDGVMRNASFLDYRMPTTLDTPMIEAILVEVPNPGHPYGVRGVGEVPIVPPLAAISNAIFDAVNVRMRTLPASPTRLLEELLSDDE